MRLMNSKGAWYLASLIGLCALFYYSISNYVFLTKDQTTLNNTTDVVPTIKPHQAEKVAHDDVQPVIESDGFIDHQDEGQIEVSNTTEPVSIGVYLDPDDDLALFDESQASHEENVGTPLDVDGEPGEQLESELSPQRSIGKYLDVDGEPSGLIYSGDSSQQIAGKSLDADGDFDNYLDLDNEATISNIGEFIDPDDLVLFQ